MKLEPTEVVCQNCGFSMKILHRIVPPEKLTEDDPLAALGIEKIPGCKASEQKVVCPQCNKSDFKEK